MLVWKVTDCDGVTRQHAGDPQGRDFTLCGLSLDGDPVVGNKRQEQREGNVTCEQCKDTINYCKAF